ncbi:hypothetical protein [Luteolibacter soli]
MAQRKDRLGDGTARGTKSPCNSIEAAARTRDKFASPAKPCAC